MEEKATAAPPSLEPQSPHGTSPSPLREDDEAPPRLQSPEDDLPPTRLSLLHGVRRARAEAAPLRSDQLAFSELAERLLLGTETRRPMECCRILDAADIPGGTLAPFQAQSLADWYSTRVHLLPTHEAVRQHCRRQLRVLQASARDPEAARLHSETLSARPSANDAEGMVLTPQRDGGHPLGGAPLPPLAALPQRVTATGDALPAVDINAMCRMHATAGAGCEACAAGGPCWINTAARILCGVDLLTEEGHASATLCREPPHPGDINKPLIDKVEKLLLQGVVHTAGREEIDHYSTVFLAAQGRDAKLDASLAAVLEGGGESASKAAAAEAARLAQQLASEYLAKAASTPASCKAAWEQAEDKLFNAPKLRLVVDFSSLSQWAPQLKMRYPELHEALSRTEAGWYVCKLDVRSGFYHVMLSERSRRLTGFSVRWHDGSIRHFRFSRLLMGARVSPWVFSLLTAIILSLLRAQGFADVSLCFVDDFIIFARTAEECERALEALKAILAELNIQWAEEKTSTTAMPKEVLLGLRCDLHEQTIALPTTKLVRLLARAAALQQLASSGSTYPSYVLASVAGGVCNLARVDDCVAAGARALASYFHGQGGRHGWARWKASLHATTAEEAEALCWLHQWAAQGHLRAVRFLPGSGQRPIIDFAGDASGTNALGITTQATRLRVNIPGCSTLGIFNLEALVLPVFLLEYGHLAPGFLFRQGCDSMSVCFTQARGSAREGIVNDLCALSSVAMRHADQGALTLFTSRYINGLADRLSVEPVVTLRSRGYLREGEGTEITHPGLPPTFLTALKAKASSSLPWRNATAWAHVTKRE